MVCPAYLISEYVTVSVMKEEKSGIEMPATYKKRSIYGRIVTEDTGIYTEVYER